MLKVDPKITGLSILTGCTATCWHHHRSAIGLCCLSADVKSGEFYEPEHTSRGPAKLTQLEPISLEADRVALWSASEAAIGETWEL